MTQIYVRDDLPPETMAMLQALYSRSPSTMVEHVAKVERVGPENFMSKYYVGYGHASIGDCGVTTLFIEDVSMLAAKAIQDWPLYSGQEASTRYMDFSKARVEDPVGSRESFAIQSAWMDFYLSAQQPVLDHLRALYPKKPEEDEAQYDRAIHARKFDVLRAFLPAGATTNLSWTTSLRQASDHLDLLMQHPDATIQALSEDIFGFLHETYPSSFRPEMRPEENEYYFYVAKHHTYYDPDDNISETSESASRAGYPEQAQVSYDFTIDRIAARRYAETLRIRPRFARLPHFLSELGMIESRFLLDFGSFRDLQRHRNGVVRMPLLTTLFGFHPWYLSQLPPSLRERAENLIKTQSAAILALAESGASKYEQQYYCAMGFRVMCKVTQGLPAFVYRIELRTQPTVHPTLRAVTQEEAKYFKLHFPWIALHADMGPDAFSLKRGNQTIIEK